MKERIHTFEQGGEYFLLDVNSGAVHLIDRMTYDLMDVFDGTNDDEAARALSGKYPEAELREALSELGMYRAKPPVFFEFSPPGASNLPVLLILAPEDLKTTEEEKGKS